MSKYAVTVASLLCTFFVKFTSIFFRCKKIFSLKKKWQQVADQLVEIARFYRFDGWFLNIENKIDVSKSEI